MPCRDDRSIRFGPGGRYPRMAVNGQTRDIAKNRCFVEFFCVIETVMKLKTLKQYLAREWQSVAVIWGLPLLALLSIKATIFQAGGLDAFIYTGYIHDYDNLIERYGPTYYAARIAFIFPARFFIWVLGEDAGYHVFRYVLLVAGTATVFGVSKKFFSVSVSVFWAVFFAFNPWILLSLLSDHYDGVAAIYLLAGVGLLVIEDRSSSAKSFFAGMMFALATNTNTFTFAIAGAFGLPWLITQWGLPYRRIVAKTAWIVGGFVGAYVVMGSAMALFYPAFGFFFEKPAISMARWLLEGGGARWYHGFEIIFSRGLYQAIFPFAFLSGAIALGVAAGGRLQHKRLFGASTVYLLIVIIIYFILHIVFKSGIWGLHYYLIYFVPAVFLSMIVIIGELHVKGGETQKTVIFSCLAVHLIFWIAGQHIPGLIGVQNQDIYAAMLVFIPVGAVLSRVLPRFALSSVAIASSLVFLATINWAVKGYAFDGMARLHSETARTLERDVYQGARFLQKTINGLGPPRVGRVRFWYSGQYSGQPGKGYYLPSVQSTFLYSYSLAYVAETVGMPVADKYFLDHVGEARFLALLGMTEKEVSNGIAALAENGVSFKPVVADQFKGQDWGYALAVVEIIPQPRPVGKVLFQVSLDDLEGINGGRIETIPDGISLATTSVSWNYSAQTKLLPNALADLAGPAIVRVRLKVEDGFLGITVTERGNTSKLLDEARIGPSGDSRFAYVRLDEISDAEYLIFRNSASPVGTRAKIFSVTVFSIPESQ